MLCLQHYTKHEAGVAAEKLSHTPEAAASAVGTAGEIVSGMAGHVVDKVGNAGISDHMRTMCATVGMFA